MKRIPILQVLQTFDQGIKIDSLGSVKIVFISKRPLRRFGIQRFVERILLLNQPNNCKCFEKMYQQTIDRITTQGRFSAETIA